MSDSEWREALVELQVRLAYQDDIIDGLNEQVANLNQQMDVLQKQMQYLVRSVRTIADGDSGAPSANEPPPHY
jgi:SlyX protein